MAISYSHTLIPNPQKEDYHSHLHNEYELLFFYEGDADYIIESETYHLQKNTLLLIKPAEYHYLVLKSSAPYRRVVINFSHLDVNDFNAEFLMSAKSIFNIEQSSPIEFLFDTINKNTFSGKELEFMRSAVLNLILMHLKTIDSSYSFTPEIANPVLHNMLSFIESNPSIPISVETLSKRFFMSSSWIVHSFKKYLGISVQQFINRKKILHAQQLIESGSSALEASIACGYEDYTTFFRQYKRFIGSSPKHNQRKV